MYIYIYIYIYTYIYIEDLDIVSYANNSELDVALKKKNSHLNGLIILV